MKHPVDSMKVACFTGDETPFVRQGFLKKSSHMFPLGSLGQGRAIHLDEQVDMPKNEKQNE